MKHILLTFCALIAMAVPLGAQAAEAIATIEAIYGQVAKLDNDTASPLKQGDEIFIGDIIKSAEGAYAEILFIDETFIALGEDTVLEVNNYVFDPDKVEDNAADINLTKGAFKFISGLIGQNENPNVQLNLDFGSIGIRGTEIWRDLIDDNGSPICRVYVENGQVDVFNDHGRVTLGHGDGTKIKGLDSAPTATKPWGKDAIKSIKAKVQRPY